MYHYCTIEINIPFQIHIHCHSISIQFIHLPLLTRLGLWRIHGSNQNTSVWHQCLIR
ncbi:hypothetical protein F383_19791 [Gossypium arboreum]|uniref:Uncharacterized protein n=1 Tax=Gossypium arboreum TaxID=29729 RepID=A0A0B0NK94_GOSAR|nr:hypothetical protein F383_19791 [Gossypium arboreum]